MRRGRLLIAAFIALAGIVSYFSMTSVNPVTGEKQRVAGITPEDEVALGLQAAPEMAQQMGGLDPDERAQRLVDEVGQRVVKESVAAGSPYQFEFHLLADPGTVNAFALPGGQIFITRALFDRLQDEAQLAGVLGHEVGHVVGRHSAEHIAKSQLAGALVGAAGVAASDPDRPGQGRQAAMVAGIVSQMMNMKYGREDELESDRLGVQFMSEADYDPEAMIGVMDILEDASGGSGQPEFFSTHPDPGNRREAIKAAIAQLRRAG